MRKNKLILIAGTNGSGKTLNIIRMIQAYKRNVLVVNPTMEKKFKGFNENYGKFEGLPTAKMIYTDIRYDREVFPAHVFPEFMNGRYIKRQAIPVQKFGVGYSAALNPILEASFYSFRSGLLVLDDASKLLRGKTSENTESLLAARRQRDTDIIAVFHSLGKIPPGIIPYCTTFIMHNVIEKSESYKYKIDDRILDLKKRVSSRARQNPYYFEAINLVG